VSPDASHDLGCHKKDAQDAGNQQFPLDLRHGAIALGAVAAATGLSP
jgi:hypothetical protein